jgi:hypothetical protein
MANDDGTLGAPERYDRKDHFYDCFSQAFEEFKYALNGPSPRFKPLENLDGVTMHYLQKPLVQFTYKRFVVGDANGADIMDKVEPDEFYREFEKFMKRVFKEISGYTLTMKKVKDDRTLTLQSRLVADRYAIAACSQGYLSRSIYRYLAQDNRIYEVTAPNLDLDDV